MAENIQFPYYAPELERAVETPPPAALQEAETFLGNPYLAELIDRGEVTLAMIRPGMDEATLLEGTDPVMAEEVESRLQGLGVLSKFSIRFDAEAVRDFYGGAPEGLMRSIGPLRHAEFADRWEEFIALMTGANTTILLLQGPDAIATLRAQLGHWDVEARRDLATIRGQLASGNYNNLLHGSDSPGSVKRELAILQACLRRQIALHGPR
jgi:nucleoside diphosphate kinase